MLQEAEDSQVQGHSAHQREQDALLPLQRGHQGNQRCSRSNEED